MVKQSKNQVTTLLPRFNFFRLRLLETELVDSLSQIVLNIVNRFSQLLGDGLTSQRLHVEIAGLGWENHETDDCGVRLSSLDFEDEARFSLTTRKRQQVCLSTLSMWLRRARDSMSMSTPLLENS